MQYLSPLAIDPSEGPSSSKAGAALGGVADGVGVVSGGNPEFVLATSVAGVLGGSKSGSLPATSGAEVAATSGAGAVVASSTETCEGSAVAAATGATPAAGAGVMGVVAPPLSNTSAEERGVPTYAHSSSSWKVAESIAMQSVRTTAAGVHSSTTPGIDIVSTSASTQGVTSNLATSCA